MEKEKFLKIYEVLARNCHKYENDCNSCPFSKECDEYAHSEFSHVNSICHKCKKWLNGCAGTENDVYTGCVYREV